MTDLKDPGDRSLSDIELFAATTLLYAAAIRASGTAAAQALDSGGAELEARIQRELHRRDAVAEQRVRLDVEKTRLRQWVVREYRGQQPLLDDILNRIQAEVLQTTQHQLSVGFLMAMIIPDALLGPGIEFAEEDIAALRAFLDTVGNAGGLTGFGSVAQA